MPPFILGPTLRLSLAYFNARCISRAVFWSEDQIAALADNLRRTQPSNTEAPGFQLVTRRLASNVMMA